MTVWILTVGEPLPIDGAVTRLFRSSILANYLVEKGHKVVRFASAFNHVEKKFRCDKDIDIEINSSYRIKLLHGIGYVKNISLQRLTDHYLIAKKFEKIVANYDESSYPDLILCSFPTITLAKIATHIGKKIGVPVILDARDMWPDVFIYSFPKFLHPFVRILLSPMFLSTKKAFSNATAITGITNSFVEWGLSYTNRAKTVKDRPFHFGYLRKEYSDDIRISTELFWSQIGLEENANKKIVSLVAYLGHIVDFDTLFEAAQILSIKAPNIIIVIAGNGDHLEYCKAKAKGFSNIIVSGWLNGSQIYSLLERSIVGLLPYKNRIDFQKSIPNKVSEYLSFGIPIVTTISGVTQKMLEDNACGYYVSDSSKLSSVIMEIANSSTLQNSLSKSATKTFDRFFDERVIYSEFVEYLENLQLNYLQVNRNLAN